MILIQLSLVGIFFIAIFLFSVEGWVLVRKKLKETRYRELINEKMRILAQLEKEVPVKERKLCLLEKVFLPNLGYNLEVNKNE
jgi:hypothetical protein